MKDMNLQRNLGNLWMNTPEERERAMTLVRQQPEADLIAEVLGLSDTGAAEPKRHPSICAKCGSVRDPKYSHGRSSGYRCRPCERRKRAQS